MFKKYNVAAFQLLETLIVLVIISAILSINFAPISALTRLRSKEEDIIYRLLVREQRRAFYTKQPVEIILSDQEIQVKRVGGEYRVIQAVKCWSNFENDVLTLTAQGTWGRGGSIFCNDQTITIGIGSSIPKRK